MNVTDFPSPSLKVLETFPQQLPTPSMPEVPLDAEFSFYTPIQLHNDVITDYLSFMFHNLGTQNVTRELLENWTDAFVASCARAYELRVFSRVEYYVYLVQKAWAAGPLKTVLNKYYARVLTANGYTLQ